MGKKVKKVMEQRAYTRISGDRENRVRFRPAKTAEVAELVATQVRLARELGAEQISRGRHCSHS